MFGGDVSSAPRARSQLGRRRRCGSGGDKFKRAKAFYRSTNGDKSERYNALDRACRKICEDEGGEQGFRCDLAP